MDIKASTPLTDINQASQANNKYKKALKQINRLIGINTSVKKQLIAVQEQYDSLRNKYNVLEQKYNALEEELQQITQGHALPSMAKAAFSYEEQKSNKAIQLGQDLKHNLVSSQRKGKEDCSPASNRGKELENTGTLSQYMDTKRKLEQVEQKLNEKEKEITAMGTELRQKNRENAELYEKYIELSNNISRLQNEVEIKEQPVVVEQLEKQKQQLQSLLTKEKQLSTKLSQENQNLKRASGSKLGASQQSMASNHKSLTTFSYFSESKGLGFGQGQGQGRPTAVPYHQSFYSSTQQSLQNSQERPQKTDPFSEYYFKKVRDLETEIQAVKKEHSEKRSKYRSQISKLKEQLNEKDQQIKQINDFIVKQQAFIESFYEKKETQQKNKKAQPKMVSSSSEYERIYQEFSTPHSSSYKVFPPEKSYDEYGISYDGSLPSKGKVPIGTTVRRQYMESERYYGS